MKRTISMKKILIVGYGSIGKRHVENLLSIPNLEIIVCTKRNDVNKLKKHAKVYHTIRQSLKENPDLGFITNETSLHIPTAMKLASQGMDLFIEKPLSNSTKGISDFTKTVNKKRIITQMGCNMRFDPCIKKIKSLVQKKAIGKIISVQVENSSYLPDWHPYENYSKGYAARDDLGGGIVLTMIHDLDYLFWIFGDIKEVFSITGKFSDLKVSADDTSAILLKFKNNIIGQIYLDYHQRPSFREIKIKGTKGRIHWNSDENKVRVFDSRKKIWSIKLAIKNNQRNKMYIDEINHFLQCVKLRKPTINPIQDGIRTLEISLGIKKSSNLKRMVRT